MTTNVQKKQTGRLSQHEKITLAPLAVKKKAKVLGFKPGVKITKCPYLLLDKCELGDWAKHLLESNKSRCYGNLTQGFYLHSSFLPLLGFVYNFELERQGYAKLFDIAYMVRGESPLQHLVGLYNNVIEQASNHYEFLVDCLKKGLLLLHNLCHQLSIYYNRPGFIQSMLKTFASAIMLETLPVGSTVLQTGLYNPDDHLDFKLTKDVDGNIVLRDKKHSKKTVLKPVFLGKAFQKTNPYTQFSNFILTF